MDASLIIPTFNRRAFLERTLASLARQTYPSSQFEVLVVDDGSTDSTGAYLQAVSFPFRLRPLLHTVNQGRAAARNTGLAAAQGGVIIFLDDDMEAVPAFVAEHLTAHRQETAAVAVIGNAMTHPALPATPLTRYLDHTGVHRLRAKAPVPFRYFNSNNSSVQHDLLKAIGFFDEMFRTYGGEDTEMGYRLYRHGTAFRYAASARSYHLGVKTLDAVCQQLHTYGRTSLFVMYQRDPVYRRALRLSVLERLDFRHDTARLVFMKLLYRLLYRTPVFRLLRWAAQHLMFGRPMYPVFDFLLSYSYLTGIRERQAAKKHQASTLL